MNDIKENGTETTFEEMFARDLIRFILQEYMIGLHWTPGIFSEQDHSPFTLQLRNVVKEELDCNAHKFHSFYDEVFPDKSFVEKYHVTHCNQTKDRFLSGVTNADFISFSVMLAMFAGLSYLYGANMAPHDTYLILVRSASELKLLGKIDENLSEEMEYWLERRIRYRRWASELVSDAENAV